MKQIPFDSVCFRFFACLNESEIVKMDGLVFCLKPKHLIINDPFLYEAELNPAGRNLIDGRNAAFGYVVEGFEVLEELTKDDTIISIDVLDGIDNLKLNA